MLREHLKNHNIILASGSPRRQQFIKDLDIDFTIDVREVDEVYPPELKGTDISDYLAKLKSEAFNDLKEKDIVITSDTIVWVSDQALGKPKDPQEAIDMLKLLSGKTHEVITSVCLKTTNSTQVFHDSTTVHFKKLNTFEIEYYVNKFKPFDKAGSYGIQEWIGFIGVEKIEGSYFTVMGLPTHKLYEELLKI